MANKVAAGVTLRHIAAVAGVAPSTVYRALAGKEGVGGETRARIAQLAHQMGVLSGAERASTASVVATGPTAEPGSGAEPGVAATAHAGVGRAWARSTLAVTLIVDSRNNPFLQGLSDNPFYLELIAGLSEASQSLGYRLSVEMVSTDEDLAVVLQHIVPEVDWQRSNLETTVLTDRRRALPPILGRGLVWLGYQPRAAYLPWVPMLARVGLPTILCDHYVDGLPCDAVVSDNIGGARALGSNVARLGHRRICILRQALPSVASWERTLGFQVSLHEAGLPAQDIQIIEAAPTFDGGYEALPKALAYGATAVLCGNDMMALGALRRAAELGVKVPAALSIAGFDDIATSARLTPALTTVRVNQRAIGSEALRRLWTLAHLVRTGPGLAGQGRAGELPAPAGVALAEGNVSGIRIVVPTQLVVRETTSEPGGGE